MKTASRHYRSLCRKELRQAQDNIAWLSEPNPVWSCGTPVAPSDRESLLSINRETVNYITSYLTRSEEQ